MTTTVEAIWNDIDDLENGSGNDGNDDDDADHKDNKDENYVKSGFLRNARLAISCKS